MNVRPLDVMHGSTAGGQRRIGTRPGLSRVFGGLAMNNKRIRMLERLRSLEGYTLKTYYDGFGAEEWGSDWTAFHETLLPLRDGAYAYINKLTDDTSAQVYSGAVLEKPDRFDRTKPYSVAIMAVENYTLKYGNGDYEIWLHLKDDKSSDSHPLANAIQVKFETYYEASAGFQGQVVNGYVAQYNSSGVVSVTTGFNPGNGMRIENVGTLLELRVTFTPASPNTVRVYWGGVLVHEQSVSAAPDTNNRVGFRIFNNFPEDDWQMAISSFTLQYHDESVGAESEEILVAAAAGGVWKGVEGDVDMIQVDTGGTMPTLATDRLIFAQELLGKLYIADYHDIEAGADVPAGLAEGKDLGIYGPKGRLLSLRPFNSITDWTTVLGAMGTVNEGQSAYDSRDEYMVIIERAMGGIPTGAYPIKWATHTTWEDYVAAGLHGRVYIDLAPEVPNGGNEFEGTCSFKVVRPPKVYDPNTNELLPLRADPGKGIAPYNCHLIAVYLNRLVLSDGRLFYMSRINDAKDWDYGQDDAAAAIPGRFYEEGAITGKGSAMVASKDDYLLSATQTSIHVLRGDPRSGGEIDIISKRVGVISQSACDFGPKGELYFIGNAGFGVLPPGGYDEPVLLSQARLPRALIGLDPEAVEVFVRYSTRDNGVYLWVLPNDTEDIGDADSPEEAYYFDIANGGFWPASNFIGRVVGPTCRFGRSTKTLGDLVFGSRTGRMYRYDDEVNTDDNSAFESYVDIGPFPIAGDDYYDGILLELIATVGYSATQNRNFIRWEIYVGDSAEEAVLATSNSDNAIAMGSTPIDMKNIKEYPRVRGAWAVVRINAGDLTAFALEQLKAKVKVAGKNRL